MAAGIVRNRLYLMLLLALRTIGTLYFTVIRLALGLSGAADSFVLSFAGFVSLALYTAALIGINQEKVWGTQLAVFIVMALELLPGVYSGIYAGLFGVAAFLFYLLILHLAVEEYRRLKGFSGQRTA